MRKPDFQRLTMLSTKLQMENSSLFHLGLAMMFVIGKQKA